MFESHIRNYSKMTIVLCDRVIYTRTAQTYCHLYEAT